MFVFKNQGTGILLEIDTYFIVGRFCRHMINYTFLLLIKQLKNKKKSFCLTSIVVLVLILMTHIEPGI